MILPQSTFQKSYGSSDIEYGYSCCQTFDNGYVIAGVKINSNSDFDIYVVKTDDHGNIQWTKTIGETGHDECRYIIQTADSGYLLAGVTNSFIAPVNGAFVIKLASNGNIEWAKTYSNINYYLNFIQQTFDGGFIFTGSKQDINAHLQDVIILKTNNSGGFEWAKTFGGDSTNIGYCIRQTSDSGFIMAGTSSNFQSSENNIYLVKTNNLGDTIWTKTIGSIQSERPLTIQQTSDGGYIIGGEGIYTSPTIFLLKINSFGTIDWLKAFGSGVAAYFGYAITIRNNGYLLAGLSRSSISPFQDIYLVRTDINGDTLWTKTIGDDLTDYIPSSASQTNDGGFILGGIINTLSNNYDALLVKTDSMGVVGCNDHFTITNLYNLSFQDLPMQPRINDDFLTDSLRVFSDSSTGTQNDLCNTNFISSSSDDFLFEINPNPARNYLNVQFDDNLQKANLEILDVSGKIISDFIIKKRNEKLSLETISPGFYFVKVYTGEKQFIRRLIVVK